MYNLGNNRGYYINFEGGDGSGKTTQFNLLSKKINAIQLSSHINKEIKSIRGYIEELSRDNIDLRLSYYLMASIHDSEKAKKLLSEGINVISDRNIYSTLAYHRAMGSNFAKSIDINKLDILKPDLTIYLNVDDEERFSRLHKRGKLSITDSHLEDNKDLLKKVLKEYKKFSEDMILIDTNKKDIEEVYVDVINEIKIMSKNIILKNS